MVSARVAPVPPAKFFRHIAADATGQQHQIQDLKCPTPKTIRKAPSGVRTSSPATNGIAAFAVTASCIRRWYANTLLMSTTKPCHQACISTSRAQFGSERNSHRTGGFEQATTTSQWLAFAGTFVGFDLLLQFLELFARNQADLLQRREVLFGFCEVVHNQISLADIFMRAAVTRTERERALIMPESGIELAGVAVGVTEVVLNIGIARVAQRCRGERRDGRTPLLGFDRLLARGV